MENKQGPGARGASVSERGLCLGLHVSESEGSRDGKGRHRGRRRMFNLLPPDVSRETPRLWKGDPGKKPVAATAPQDAVGESLTLSSADRTLTVSRRPEPRPPPRATATPHGPWPPPQATATPHGPRPPHTGHSHPHGPRPQAFPSAQRGFTQRRVNTQVAPSTCPERITMQHSVYRVIG